MGTRRFARRWANGFGLYLAVALGLVSILSVAFLLKSKAFAFEDVGSDTLLSYYPLQLAVARQLKALHSVTWSFDLGLGGFLGTLFDPLWLLTGWLPGQWQLSLRLPMFMLRLVLAGGFFYGYLRQVRLDAPVAIIGGLGYAFSSYGVISSQWEVSNGTEFVQFAALLFLLECQLRRPGKLPGIAAGALVGIGHPLGLYMFSLLAAAYAAVRLFLMPANARRPTLRALAGFALWSLPGLALAAPLLLPSLYYFLESPRVIGEHSQLHALLGSLLTLTDGPTITTEFAGLVGKDLLGTGSHHVGWGNYFEGPGFYVGLFPLFCIAQLGGPRASSRERALLAIGLGGTALYFVWPPLRYAVYGFGHYVFRFSTLWISAILLVLGLLGFQRALRSGWWRPGIVIATLSLLAIIGYVAARVPAAVAPEHLVRIAPFIALYTALASLSAAREQRTWNTGYLFVALCACELLVFAAPALLGRDAVGRDGAGASGRYDDGSAAALARVRELESGSEFFRIEKTFASVNLSLADALAQDYPGTASYYFHAAALTRFVDSMELPRPVAGWTNVIGPMTSRPLMLDLLGVRYVLTRKRSLDGAAGMTYAGTTGDIDIYRNERARGFGTFYDSIASEAEARALPVPERDALLLRAAVVDDDADVRARLAALRPAPGAANLRQRASIVRVADNHLGGEVDTPTASVLLLSMPFDRGWSASLDGSAVELFRADFGLTAALVPAGAHTIAVRYVPPGRTLGFSAMAGAIAFIGMLELFSARARTPSGTRRWWMRLPGFRRRDLTKS